MCIMIRRALWHGNQSQVLVGGSCKTLTLVFAVTLAEAGNSEEPYGFYVWLYRVSDFFHTLAKNFISSKAVCTEKHRDGSN